MDFSRYELNPDLLEEGSLESFSFSQLKQEAQFNKEQEEKYTQKAKEAETAKNQALLKIIELKNKIYREKYSQFTKDAITELNLEQLGLSNDEIDLLFKEATRKSTKAKTYSIVFANLSKIVKTRYSL